MSSLPFVELRGLSEAAKWAGLDGLGRLATMASEGHWFESKRPGHPVHPDPAAGPKRRLPSETGSSRASSRRSSSWDSDLRSAGGGGMRAVVSSFKRLGADGILQPAGRQRAQQPAAASASDPRAGDDGWRMHHRAAAARGHFGLRLTLAVAPAAPVTVTAEAAAAEAADADEKPSPAQSTSGDGSAAAYGAGVGEDDPLGAANWQPSPVPSRAGRTLAGGPRGAGAGARADGWGAGATAEGSSGWLSSAASASGFGYASGPSAAESRGSGPAGRRRAPPGRGRPDLTAGGGGGAGGPQGGAGSDLLLLQRREFPTTPAAAARLAARAAAEAAAAVGLSAGVVSRRADAPSEAPAPGCGAAGGADGAEAEAEAGRSSLHYVPPTAQGALDGRGLGRLPARVEEESDGDSGYGSEDEKEEDDEEEDGGGGGSGDGRQGGAVFGSEEATSGGGTAGGRAGVAGGGPALAGGAGAAWRGRSLPQGRGRRRSESVSSVAAAAAAAATERIRRERAGTSDTAESLVAPAEPSGEDWGDRHSGDGEEDDADDDDEDLEDGAWESRGVRSAVSAIVASGLNVSLRLPATASPPSRPASSTPRAGMSALLAPQPALAAPRPVAARSLLGPPALMTSSGRGLAASSAPFRAVDPFAAARGALSRRAIMEVAARPAAHQDQHSDGGLSPRAASSDAADADPATWEALPDPQGPPLQGALPGDADEALPAAAAPAAAVATRAREEEGTPDIRAVARQLARIYAAAGAGSGMDGTSLERREAAFEERIAAHIGAVAKGHVPSLLPSLPGMGEPVSRQGGPSEAGSVASSERASTGGTPSTATDRMREKRRRRRARQKDRRRAAKTDVALPGVPGEEADEAGAGGGEAGRRAVADATSARAMREAAAAGDAVPVPATRRRVSHSVDYGRRGEAIATGDEDAFSRELEAFRLRLEAPPAAASAPVAAGVGADDAGADDAPLGAGLERAAPHGLTPSKPSGHRRGSAGLTAGSMPLAPAGLLSQAPAPGGAAGHGVEAPPPVEPLGVLGLAADATGLLSDASSLLSLTPAPVDLPGAGGPSVLGAAHGDPFGLAGGNAIPAAGALLGAGAGTGDDAAAARPYAGHGAERGTQELPPPFGRSPLLGAVSALWEAGPQGFGVPGLSEAALGTGPAPGPLLAAGLAAGHGAEGLGGEREEGKAAEAAWTSLGRQARDSPPARVTSSKNRATRRGRRAGSKSSGAAKAKAAAAGSGGAWLRAGRGGSAEA